MPSADTPVFGGNVELISQFKETKKHLIVTHEEYLKQHPEINHLTSDYLKMVLQRKPEDVYQFTQDYFAMFLGGSKYVPEPEPQPVELVATATVTAVEEESSAIVEDATSHGAENNVPATTETQEQPAEVSPVEEPEVSKRVKLDEEIVAEQVGAHVVAVEATEKMVQQAADASPLATLPVPETTVSADETAEKSEEQKLEEGSSDAATEETPAMEGTKATEASSEPEQQKE